MPTIQNKNFNQLVSDFAVAVQGRAIGLLDFTIGSILRSLGEAVSAVTVWLEGLIILLLQTTRAATSSDGDLDTFVNDFGLARLPAVAADGQVVFSRFTPQQVAVIPVGAQVVTSDQTQTYLVVADTSQPNFVPAQNAYVVPVGMAVCTATVQAVNAGAQGNVGAGTITVLASAVSFIDTVTNPQPFTSGEDPETDVALRMRFIAWFAGLSKATREAITAAVLALQSGVSCSITENVDYDGTPDVGSFYVVVDDGSGTPPTSFLSSVFNAVDTTRACGIRPAVFGPITVQADIFVACTVAAGYDAVATRALVAQAIDKYVANLGLGNALAWSRLYQVAYDASPGVTEVAGLTVNGGVSDISATSKERIIVGTVQVN